MRKNNRYFKILSEDFIELSKHISHGAAHIYFLLLSHITVELGSNGEKNLIVRISQRKLAEEFYMEKHTSGKAGKHNSSIGRFLKELLTLNVIQYLQKERGEISKYLVGKIIENNDVFLLENIYEDAADWSLLYKTVNPPDVHRDAAMCSGYASASSPPKKVNSGEHQSDAPVSYIYNPYKPKEHNPSMPVIPQKNELDDPPQVTYGSQKRITTARKLVEEKLDS